ncbi:hypothetical protein F5B20DRAFT_269437 [Whalleya microplaca]|nr:hypothetical protein F5B20DRAFT_269437 [Whalleya microplaca]
MNPPSASGDKPVEFWGAAKANLLKEVNRNSAVLYYRVFGGSDPTVAPREVQWTLDDFVCFFDCEECNLAWTAYRDEFLKSSPYAASPSWNEVYVFLQNLFKTPDILPDYIGLRKADEVDRTEWMQVDYISAFVLRLLNYRSHLEFGTCDTRTDFMRRQAAFAKSVGASNPFYQSWDGSDKWVAAYLLYTKLMYEQDRFAIDHLHSRPNNYDEDAQKLAEGGSINPAVQQERERMVSESKWPWYKHLAKHGRFSSEFAIKSKEEPAPATAAPATTAPATTDPATAGPATTDPATSAPANKRDPPPNGWES